MIFATVKVDYRTKSYTMFIHFSSGVKYILRTDIMYRKTDGAEVDPKEEEALQLVQEAERLEVNVHVNDALGK